MVWTLGKDELGALAEKGQISYCGRSPGEMKALVCVIIWGENDSVTPPNVAEEFHELLPDSDLFWIPKCGHAPMMEHPGEFNTILHAWLQQRGF